VEPPICEVCDDDADPSAGGRLVRFIATDAGRALEGCDTPGHSPDLGWFCVRHVAAAEELRASHTLRLARTKLRRNRPMRPPPTDGWEARRATQVVHQLIDGRERGVVEAAILAALDLAAEVLGFGSIDPVEHYERSRSNSPELHDQLMLTDVVIRRTWAAGGRQLEFSHRSSVWDSWSGIELGGDLFQGTLAATVDDTWIFATYASDGIVDQLSESGVRTPACSDIIDDLIDGLRSPS